jgi:hypothetical protein
MISFAVIEVEDGLTIVEIPAGQSPEDAAITEGGTLVDPGPYHSYEDASDALDELEMESEEDR